MVYVVDPDTYELLYINDNATMNFGLCESTLSTCYNDIANRHTPCSFCPIKNKNIKNHRDNMLINKRPTEIVGEFIDWPDGRKVWLATLTPQITHDL